MAQEETWEAHSTTDEIKRQGPHQSATNSTRTGISDPSTSAGNSLWSIWTSAPQRTESLLAARRKGATCRRAPHRAAGAGGRVSGRRMRRLRSRCGPNEEAEGARTAAEGEKLVVAMDGEGAGASQAVWLFVRLVVIRVHSFGNGESRIAT